MPLYRTWYRARLAWTFNDRPPPHAAGRIPAWEHSSTLAQRVSTTATASTSPSTPSAELGDRADELAAKVVPTYPPYGKRMLMDNGWYRMLRNPKVTLVDDPITEVEPRLAGL